MVKGKSRKKGLPESGGSTSHSPTKKRTKLPTQESEGIIKENVNTEDPCKEAPDVNPSLRNKGKGPFKRLKCMAKKLRPKDHPNQAWETVNEDDTDESEEVAEPRNDNGKRATSIVKSMLKRLADDTDTDDDFSVQPKREFEIKPKHVQCRRRGIKQPICKEEGYDMRFPSISTRTTPAALFDRLHELNEKQREAVREMGFGHLLELKVKDLPAKLAYWVVDKFNSRRCELEVNDGCRVKVTEDDVYRVFGFSKGTEQIVPFERTSNNELMEQWVSFFEVECREKIKIGQVLRVMVNSRDGGSWFKRHFMIAVAFSLIESCTSGTVHPFILRCLADVHTLSRWNWSEYVLRSLIDHKRSWAGNKNKVFAGPVLFLVLFYVDRIEINRISDRRLFPVLINWTSDSLRKRQRMEMDDGNFGGGDLREPITLPAEDENQQKKDVEDARGEQGSRSSRIMKQAQKIAQHMA